MFRNWIKRTFSLYDMDDLEVGAHCGCCGEWMAKEIVPKCWTWSLCEKCIKESLEGQKFEKMEGVSNSLLREILWLEKPSDKEVGIVIDIEDYKKDGKTSDEEVDRLYAVAIDILMGLERKDLVDGLEKMVNLMCKKNDTNLTKVNEIIDIVRVGLPEKHKRIWSFKKQKFIWIRGLSKNCGEIK